MTDAESFDSDSELDPGGGTTSVTQKITTLPDGTQKIKTITEKVNLDGSTTKTITTKIVPFAATVQLDAPLDDYSSVVPVAVPEVLPCSPPEAPQQLQTGVGTPVRIPRANAVSAFGGSGSAYPGGEGGGVSAQYDERSIALPSGRVGLRFAGRPPAITKIYDDSPLVGSVVEGQIIRGLVVGGRTERNLNASSLARLLKSPAAYDGICLLVKLENRIVLPLGRVGLKFAGAPPEITDVHDDSPLSGQVDEGQIICGVVINGITERKLSSTYLAGLLNSSAMIEGRVLLVEYEKKADDNILEIPDSAMAVLLPETTRQTNSEHSSDLHGRGSLCQNDRTNELQDTESSAALENIGLGEDSCCSSSDHLAAVREDRMAQAKGDAEDRHGFAGDESEEEENELPPPVPFRPEVGTTDDTDATGSGPDNGRNMKNNLSMEDPLLLVMEDRLARAKNDRTSDISAAEYKEEEAELPPVPYCTNEENSFIEENKHELPNDKTTRSAVEILLPTGEDQLSTAQSDNYRTDGHEVEFVADEARVQNMGESGSAGGEQRNSVSNRGSSAEEAMEEQRDSDARYASHEALPLGPTDKPSSSGGPGCSASKEECVPLRPGKAGIKFKGYPPTITEIFDDSPLQIERLKVGQTIRGIIVDGWTERDIDVSLLASLLKSSENCKERALIVGEDCGTSTPSVHEKVKIRVPLPPGRTGIKFKGSPPKIIKVFEDSPLVGKICVGQIVCGVTIDGQTERDLDTDLLASILRSSAACEGRALIIAEKDCASPPAITYGTEIHVSLPPGHAGIELIGSPPEIIEISEDSPLLGQVEVGQIICGITIDGQTERNLESSLLVSLLHSSVQLQSRFLHISEKQKPQVEMGLDDSLASPSEGDANNMPPDEHESFERVGNHASLSTPDVLEIRVPLPPGKTRISFKGSPPEIKRVSNHSPLIGQVREGQIICGITVDGQTERDLNTSLLASLLQSSVELQDRFLHIVDKPKPQVAETLHTSASSSNGGSATVPSTDRHVSSVNCSRCFWFGRVGAFFH